MSNRRKFLQSSILSSIGVMLAGSACRTRQNEPTVAGHPTDSLGTVAVTGQPVVISTWDTGAAANKGAWEVLGRGGSALDAVEAGVKVTESSINCCVGLGANPDRDGHVTL